MCLFGLLCLMFVKDFSFEVLCIVMLLTIESLICKQKCTSTVWGYFGFIPKSDNSNQHKDPNEMICKICFKEMGSLPTAT